MLLIALFFIFYTLPSCVLAFLQIRHIKSNQKVVLLNESDFLLAKHYALTCQVFNIAESLFGALIFGFWIYFGLSILFNNESGILLQAGFLAAFIILNSIFSLPFNAYKTLIIDKKFGFSKLDFKLFMQDFFKSLFISLILGFILCAILLYLMQAFALWWLFGFIVLFCVIILANLIYPTLIAPMFNKFSPLNDENLKNKIEQMMNLVGFKANGIFVMDASRRDGRLNAYFGGLGKSKRVVLFDTLLNKVSQSELLAILGHELAHFKHGDLYKNIALMAFMLFILFFISAHLPEIFFSQIPNNNASLIAILILIAPLILFYFLPIINFFSRRAEFGADRFGAELTNKADLKNALKKLINENKAFPYAHKLYVFFYMSHPPLLERLRALD